jgi:hypothetical protein
MRTWLFATALAVLSAFPALACTVVIRDDPGGVIEEYEQRLADYNARGCLVELHGAITSSATIFLGADRVCLGLPMSAHFHRPSWNGKPMAPVDFQYWKHRIASHYPASVRVWYMLNIQNNDMHHTVKRAELLRVGFAPCA